MVACQIFAPVVAACDNTKGDIMLHIPAIIWVNSYLHFVFSLLQSFWTPDILMPAWVYLKEDMKYTLFVITG